MPMLERVLKFLNANRVEYLHAIHEPVFTARELASVEHLPLRDVAKVVVFWSERGCALAVIPAESADTAAGTLLRTSRLG